MHTNNISAETTSLEFQLRLHEEMLDTAMKHDFEFAKSESNLSGVQKTEKQDSGN